MLLTLACAFVACNQPLPTAAPEEGPLLAQATGDITVVYECGNTFLFRNRSLDTLTLTWRVRGNHEGGSVFLPARPESGEFSETRVTTKMRGPLEVYRSGRILRTVPNGHGAACPEVPSDTTRPAMPDSFVWPRGAAIRTVQAAGDSMTPLYDNLVLVEFDDSASGPSMRALIASLRGTIVGGFPRAGYYVIVIPAVANYDSLLAAVRVLRASPIVAGAMAAPYGEAADLPFGVYPEDGARSPRSSMHSASSADVNWSKVAIRAPLAWGCEQGQSADPVTIGVLDYYFDATDPDLAPGTTLIEPSAVETQVPSAGTAANIDSAIVRSHGQGVAGVVGAIGNDSNGVAGIIWQRNLRLYALTNGPQTIANFPIYVKDRLVPDLISSGVRAFVASLSFGSADETVYPELERRFLPYFQHGGVLVMPTDNYEGTQTLVDLQGIRLRTGGLRRLSAAMYVRFPGQVWYVAGMNRAGHRMGTTFSGIEDVAAPAEDVLTLGRPADFGGNPDSAVRAPDGVSFAAPAVLGAAALLWTREPAKTGPEILNLLKDGALMDRLDPFTGVIRRPPTVAAGVGLIDIYSSLKVQAQRANVPLCGNRLWVDGNTVVAARGASVQEIVATLPNNVGFIWPYHGGRRVVIQDAVTWDTYSTSLSAGGTWSSPAEWDGDDAGLAGNGPAIFGWNHDRDSLAYVRADSMVLGPRYQGPGRQFKLPVEQAIQTGGIACTREIHLGDGWSCIDSTFAGTTINPSWNGTGYPVGQQLIFAHLHRTESTSRVSGPAVDCFNDTPTDENTFCRKYATPGSMTLLGSEVWRLDVTSGVTTKAVDLPGRWVVSVTGSEDGGEIAVASEIWIGSGTATDCRIDFYPSSVSSGQAPLETHSTGQTCQPVDWQGGFGAARQQLTSARQPSTAGFALQARMMRAASH